ncbi:MAG: hypothetical protein FJ306_01520 [Planctomycetes bacterium]|nr:hypothetical protein [Planctomycetota bacterium]
MNLFSLITALAITGAASFTLARLPVAPLASNSHARITDPEPREGTLTTLRSLDDLTATLGFPGGEYGTAVAGNEVCNRNSHLTYDRFTKNALVVGIQGGSEGVIQDIGDVRTRSTASSVLPFLQLRDGVVFDTSSEKSAVPEAGISLQGRARGAATAEAKLGHVYLVRIDEANKSLFAAVRIVELEPGQSVTLRWRML